MPATLSQLRQHGAYLQLDRTSYDAAGRHYTSACLAAGLKRLGIPVYANFNDELFAEVPPGAERPLLNLFPITEENNSPRLMQEIWASAAQNKCILSHADTVSTIFTPPGVPSLMTHETQFRRMVHGARFPWAFGLSDAMMAAPPTPVPFTQRRPVILRNFRPSANQQIRNMLDWTLVPHLEKHFAVDRAISADHQLKLGQYLGCLAYGGSWEEDLAPNSALAAHPEYHTYRQELVFHRPVAILRWDSWRWWESLAAGCLTFNLDFEKHGLMLPVVPEAWKHYVPVDLSDPKATIERLLDERARWPEIAANGRVWARTHYSPDAVAARLVDYVAPVQAPAASGR